MNENNPPISQPSGATCPNCGAAQNVGVPYCTHCGAPLNAAKSGSLSSTSKIILSIALTFGALMFGALGGCFFLLFGIEGSQTFDPAILLFVGIPVLLALACIWGIWRVQRKK